MNPREVEILIDVENLYYSYTKDEKYAVNDVSFQIGPGEVLDRKSVV